jgi:hypothetical protein
MNDILSLLYELFLNEYVIILVILSWSVILLYLLFRPRNKKLKVIATSNNDVFVDHLMKKDQVLFKSLFMNVNKDEQVLHYNYGQNNDVFFHNVENYLYQYRDQLSDSLALAIYLTTEKLYLEEKKNTETLFQAKIKLMYYLRHRFPSTLLEVENLTKTFLRENKFNKNKLELFSYVYHKLIMSLENQNKISEGIQYCEEAVKLNLIDDTVNGFVGRLNRLQRSLSTK